jgi:iron complex transport system ATP-binding protein
MSTDAPAMVATGIGVTLGAAAVLDDVSIELQPGHWTAIVGPNGAGKSTLLSVLAGLRRPDRGQVRVGGMHLAALPARERARRVAWLAQQGEADGDLTVRTIAGLGRLPHQGLFGSPDARDLHAVERALEATGSTAFAHRRLGELSGGERQRALLARVLAVQAPVVLLDEPTTHLDPPHQRAVLRCITGLVRQQAAVAAVLHDLTLALAADQVVVMARGRVQASGAPGDPAVHAAIEAVFEQAIVIRSIEADAGTDAGPRWVALPSR